MVSKKRAAILLIFSLVFTILFSINAFAGVKLITNTQNWQDVYSALQYGKYMGREPFFLVSDRHSTVILAGFDTSDSIQFFTSKDSPFVIGYEAIARSKGFQNVSERIIDGPFNLELAYELEGIHNFIVIDDAYGYNAIAVGPYASVSHSYVLFANKDNIDDVIDFLNSREVNNVLIYGRVDREVFEALQDFDPEVINNDGDRFANNVEIVKKYKEISDKTQVLFSNGEFIEADLVNGDFPVLFLGKQNLPDLIREYIKNSNIRVGVLVGNDLVGTATAIRRSTGISTFVKFARSARIPDGPISRVEGLDLFPLPRYELNITIDSIRYNTITRKLEVTYKNNADLAVYFKGTYSVNDDGKIQTVGDVNPIFLDKLSTKTLLYDIEPITSEEATVKVYTIYGEAKNSLEFTLDGVYPLGIVSVADDSLININSVSYNKRKQEFYVEIENVGPTDAYVDTELLEVKVLGEKMNFGSEEVIFVRKGAKKESVVPADLSDEDLMKNKKIKVRAYYGEHEDALVKMIEGEFELKVSSGWLVVYLPVVLIIILILLILLTGKKKKECHECGHSNKSSARHCKKCGARLKKRKK